MEQYSTAVETNVRIIKTFSDQRTPIFQLFDCLKKIKLYQMTQRKFSMKKMALKSTFGFTTVNHYYTEEERQVGPNRFDFI